MTTSRWLTFRLFGGIIRNVWANCGVKGTGITTPKEKDTKEQDLDYGTAGRKVTEEFRENTLELQGERGERGAFIRPEDPTDAESERPTEGVRRKLQSGITKEGDGAVDRGR